MRSGTTNRYWDGGYSQHTNPVQISRSAIPDAVALDEDDRTHPDLHTDSALEQQAEIARPSPVAGNRAALEEVRPVR